MTSCNNINLIEQEDSPFVGMEKMHNEVIDIFGVRRDRVQPRGNFTPESPKVETLDQPLQDWVKSHTRVIPHQLKRSVIIKDDVIPTTPNKFDKATGTERREVRDFFTQNKSEVGDFSTQSSIRTLKDDYQINAIVLPKTIEKVNKSQAMTTVELINQLQQVEVPTLDTLVIPQEVITATPKKAIDVSIQHQQKAFGNHRGKDLTVDPTLKEVKELSVGTEVKTLINQLQQVEIPLGVYPLNQEIIEPQRKKLSTNIGSQHITITVPILVDQNQMTENKLPREVSTQSNPVSLTNQTLQEQTIQPTRKPHKHIGISRSHPDKHQSNQIAPTMHDQDQQTVYFGNEYVPRDEPNVEYEQAFTEEEPYYFQSAGEQAFSFNNEQAESFNDELGADSEDQLQALLRNLELQRRLNYIRKQDKK